MKTTIDMAREAGLLTWLKPPEDVIERFKAFEALVRADERNRTWTQEHWTEYEKSLVQAEREANSKVRAGKPRKLPRIGMGMLHVEQQHCFEMGWKEGVAAVRAAIRERGNK